MPTPLQIQLIHVAAKQAGLVEAQYRTLLRNVGGVESSKLLNQAGFEDCMAVIEDSGFRERDKPGDYWRAKVASRGTWANPRMTAKIHALAADSRYALAAMCERFSAGRADCPEQLHPREAWNLIEMLKASSAREARNPNSESPNQARNPKSEGPNGGQNPRARGPAAAAQGTLFPMPARSAMVPEPAKTPRPASTPVRMGGSCVEDEEDVPF